MKTTIELPDALMHAIKIRAAQRRQKLKDFVQEALQARLSANDAADLGGQATQAGAAQAPDAWQAYRQRLQRLPDGSYYNPDGLEDEEFFAELERVRAESRFVPREPFAAD